MGCCSSCTLVGQRCQKSDSLGSREHNLVIFMCPRALADAWKNMNECVLGIYCCRTATSELGAQGSHCATFSESWVRNRERAEGSSRLLHAAQGLNGAAGQWDWNPFCILARVPQRPAPPAPATGSDAGTGNKGVVSVGKM